MWAGLSFLVTFGLSLLACIADRQKAGKRADTCSPKVGCPLTETAAGDVFPMSTPGRGLTVWAVILLGMAVIGWSHPFAQAFTRPMGCSLLLLAASWLLGYACDRRPVPRWLRIGSVAMIAILLSLLVTSFDSVKAPFTAHFVVLGDLATPLTAVWVFVVTYAFFGANLLPGLAVGLTAVISLTLLGVGLLQPQAGGWMAVALGVPVAGAACGQLGCLRGRFYERMDSGTSLSLGLAIALVTVSGALKNTAFLVLLLPVLILGAPLLDVSYAILRKQTTNSNADLPSSPFSVCSRRMRLHDALLNEGIPVERVTGLLIGIDVYLCCLALVLVWAIRLSFLVKLLLMVPFLTVGGVFFYALSKLFGRRAQAEPGETVSLLDVSLTPVSMQEAMDRVDEFVASGQPHMIVTSDSSLIVRAQEDPEFFEIVNQADMVTADGIGVVLSARLLNLPVFERVSGCDMVDAMCELSARKGHRLFFLGGAPGVAARAAQNLCLRYPGMVIAGAHHGYFGAEDEEAVVAMIRGASTDILFVALGIPKQERFIRKHMEQMQAAVCIGVGGSLDVYAGEVKRAPVWMQRVGLEWLYRTACQPRRVGRLVSIPQLLYLTFRRLLQKPGRSKRTLLARKEP